jgi:thiosulfate dehydrogenase (quinone) large subunit
MTGTSALDELRARGTAFWLAVVASVLLIALYIADVADALGLGGLADAWSDLLAIGAEPITLGTIATWAFWISAIALTVVLFQSRRDPGAAEVEIEGPAAVRFLFYNTRAGLLWLPIRIFLGFAWLDSGLHKLVNAAWQDGTALTAFWERVVAVPEAPARPPITYEWYRDFLQALLDGGHAGWFGWLVMLGEVAVGLGLLFGVLTGIAAFFGALMNMSFLLAGTASTNPVLFTLAIGIMLAWRVAGYYGFDRTLLPMLGTPWTRGPLARNGSSGGTAGGSEGTSGSA